MGIVIAAVLAPPEEESLLISKEHAERLAAANTLKTKPVKMIPADRLEWWPGWSLIVGGAMLLYFGLQVRTVGLGRAWTIDNYNLLFLALGLLLHWYPSRFSPRVKKASETPGES